MAARRAALILAAALAWPGVQAHAAGPRGEVPVFERRLGDGTLRYAVPIRVGGVEIEAGLDTGSTGLRLLDAPGAAAGRREAYVFANGVRAEGTVSWAEVSFGGRAGPVQAQAVMKVRCAPARPRCPASDGGFGFMGGGVPGAGFRALFGVGLAGPVAANPLRALGVRRWIVSLPRPGEARPGKLVLDPDEADLEGFVLLPLEPQLAWRKDASHDAVRGCLDDGHGMRSCGPVLLDTGTARMVLVNGSSPADRFGREARLSFLGPQGATVEAMTLVLGDPARASRLAAARDSRAPRALLVAGVAPYFAYDVLYDAERNLIGLRPRPPAPPQGGKP